MKHITEWLFVSSTVATNINSGKLKSHPNAFQLLVHVVVGHSKIPLNVRRDLAFLRHSNRPNVYWDRCFVHANVGVHLELIVCDCPIIVTVKLRENASFWGFGVCVTDRPAKSGDLLANGE